jgi:hypothetical protein
MEEEKRQAGRPIRPDILKKLRQMQKKVTIREAAFEVMDRAYMKASGGGRLPANARQVYYAARPWILDMTGEEKLKSQYFTQILLKDYMEGYDPPWDVVFDARGISRSRTPEL